MITLLPWVNTNTRKSVKKQIAEEVNDELFQEKIVVTKSQTRKSSKKRKQYKERQQLMSALVERVMTKVPEEKHADALYIQSAVQDLIYWGNADVRQKARSYGSKRKSAPKVRSSFIKHRTGDALPIPEWSWQDVRGSGAVYYS